MAEAEPVTEDEANHVQALSHFAAVYLRAHRAAGFNSDFWLERLPDQRWCVIARLEGSETRACISCGVLERDGAFEQVPVTTSYATRTAFGMFCHECACDFHAGQAAATAAFQRSAN